MDFLYWGLAYLAVGLIIFGLLSWRAEKADSSYRVGDAQFFTGVLLWPLILGVCLLLAVFSLGGSDHGR